MTLDITTSIATQLDRIVDGMLDDMASEGLVLLKSILDEAGFRKSPFLKDYQVMAHVVGRTVVFEILLDLDSVVPQDEATKKAIEDSRQEGDALEESASSSYAMGPDGPQRIVGKQNALRDARTPARDARRPARDARKGSRDRLVEKEIANVTPRSATVTRDGRLSLAMKRTARTDGEEIVMPQSKFQGIIGRFLSEIRTVIAARFSPGIARIVSKSTS